MLLDLYVQTNKAVQLFCVLAAKQWRTGPIPSQGAITSVKGPQSGKGGDQNSKAITIFFILLLILICGQHRRHLLHRQLMSTFLKRVLSSSFFVYFVIASSAEASLGQIVAQLGGQLPAGALVLAAEDKDEERGEDEGDCKDEKDQDQVSFRLYCCTTQAEVAEVVVS